MKVTRNTVVRMDYTLTDPEGEVIDTSDGQEPLTYLQGHGQIVPGLERAMEGRSVGDPFTVVVSPEEGYGEYDKEKILRVPRRQVPKDLDIAPGNTVTVHNDQGEEMEFTIAGSTPTELLLDGNHPLAGVELHFLITIRAVRGATPEELHHGHAHGPGGAHHH